MNAISNIKTAAESLWFGNTLITIKVASAAGQDGISVIEHWMPYGDSPPLHVHRNEDEVFHVLQGMLRLRVDGRDVLAQAGETVLAPKGVPHSYCVESRDGARVLTIVRGGDFEGMVRATSCPALTADLPEKSAPTPDMVAALVASCAENGIDIVGAPLSPVA